MPISRVRASCLGLMELLIQLLSIMAIEQAAHLLIKGLLEGCVFTCAMLDDRVCCMCAAASCMSASIL